MLTYEVNCYQDLLTFMVLHDIDKDETGEYIDSYIFEVMNDEPIYK